jgi:hypothetical protein
LDELKKGKPLKTPGQNQRSKVDPFSVRRSTIEGQSDEDEDESDWDDEDYPQVSQTPKTQTSQPAQTKSEVETKVVVIPSTYYEMYHALANKGLITNAGKIWDNGFAKQIVDEYQLNDPNLPVSFEEYVEQVKTKNYPPGVVYHPTGPPLRKKPKQSTSNKYRFKYHMVKRVLRSLH